MIVHVWLMHTRVFSFQDAIVLICVAGSQRRTCLWTVVVRCCSYQLLTQLVSRTRAFRLLPASAAVVVVVVVVVW
jgi:hypothetical protein